MIWNRASALGMARTSCARCHGYGTRPDHRREIVCGCTLRSIFRACLARYFELDSRHDSAPTICWEFHARGADNRRCYGRKREEYLADFYLIARRTLALADWRLFGLHFLQGLGWKLCCRALRLSRGNFFHAVYRIEEALGRAYAETAPYGLWPLDEYFGSHSETTHAPVPARLSDAARDRDEHRHAPQPGLERAQPQDAGQPARTDAAQLCAAHGMRRDHQVSR